MFARSARFWLPAFIGLALIPAAPAGADWAAAEAALKAKDYAQAEAELRPLAEAGDSVAKYHLAAITLDRKEGNEAEAIRLLTESATAGEPQAQARLGILYARGEAGLPRDDVLAFKWLTMAARGAKPGVSRILADTNKNVVAIRLNEEERQQAISAAQQLSSVAPEEGAVAPAPEPTPVQQVAASAIAAPSDETQEIDDTAELPEPASLETAAAAPAASGLTGDLGGDLGKSIRIQLASVEAEGAVEGEWRRLQKRLGSAVAGLAMHIEPADLGTKGKFFRIQAGPFADRAAAAQACKAIRAANSSGCLVVLP
jgi:uncharacterized protein